MNGFFTQAVKLNLISFFDFFLPRFCIVCNEKLLSHQSVICTNCSNTLEIASADRIYNEYSRKFIHEKVIKDFSSAYVFIDESTIQKIIHSLKYDQNISAGRFLANKILEVRGEILKRWEIDYILPIPLHRLRKAERGFNQSQIIAFHLGKLSNTKVLTNILYRNKYTDTQTKLGFNERKLNIKDAFIIKNNSLIKNKNILLIDDVITTGATISECGKLLMEKGAKGVFALSVAIAD